jgi:hypothetical protein
MTTSLIPRYSKESIHNNWAYYHIQKFLSSYKLMIILILLLLIQRKKQKANLKIIRASFNKELKVKKMLFNFNLLRLEVGYKVYNNKTPFTLLRLHRMIQIKTYLIYLNQALLAVLLIHLILLIKEDLVKYKIEKYVLRTEVIKFGWIIRISNSIINIIL